MKTDPSANNKKEISDNNKQKSNNEKKSDNQREFLYITYFFVAIFLGLIVYMGIFISFKSESFINNPYNKRISSQSEKIIRGDIVTRDNKIIATTKVDDEGNEKRYFPDNEEYSIVAGHTMGEGMGIEKAFNFELLRSHVSFLNRFFYDIAGEKQPGDTVITTLDSSLQDTAYNELKDKTGAVVVINSKTGEILTMVSTPGFNPNNITSDWEEILSSNDAILYNRATKGLYPPGSTFKLVTTLDYIREFPDEYDNYTYNCNSSINISGSEIHCYNNNAHGNLQLINALEKSCNCAFADISQKLNSDTFTDTANDLLFNSSLPTSGFECSTSVFDIESASDSLIARSAIGQGNVLVSPYHMCLIAAAIQNDGVLMEPYIVSEIKSVSQKSVKKYKPETFKRLLSKKEAKQLRKYMKSVAKSGTASALYNDNYTVAGKTGSAEFSSNKNESHAWFVGYANSKEKDPIAIAVIVENGGSGSKTAVPIAKKVFDTYFLQ